MINFNLETAGVTTKKGGTSRSNKEPEFDRPVFIIDQEPGEGSKSWKFRVNKLALELLGYDTESNEDQAFTFILGDTQEDESLHGRLFVGRFGEENLLNKAWKDGYAEGSGEYANDFKETRSNKTAYEAIVGKFDWIDTSDSREVCFLELVPNESGVAIAEVTPYVEDATPEEERPDVDTAAQEAEDVTAMW